jgi:hypothetical protein
VHDYGDPLTPGYNSLEYMGGKRLAQEPIRHAYRGMSTAYASYLANKWTMPVRQARREAGE